MSAPSLHRQRLYRERQKRGLRCVTLEIRNRELAELTRRGLLAAGAQDDREAVRQAMYNFLDQALQGPH